MIVLATRQHKQARGIQMTAKSNSKNRKAKNTPIGVSFCFSNSCLFRAQTQIGRIASTKNNQIKIGNNDAQDWRSGSIQIFLRLYGSHVTMHLNIEMLEVIMEKICKVVAV